MKKIYSFLSRKGYVRSAGKRITPLTLLALSLAFNAGAQYKQDFNTLVSTTSGTFNTLPDGWGIYEVGTSGSADGRYAANNGSSNAGNTYSYGNDGEADRALGTLASGSNAPTIGAIFFNETDATINSVTISFTLEQWRFGAVRSGGVIDVIPFSYSLDATSIANTAPGTWVPVPQLNLSSIITSGTAGRLDGNLPANRKDISYTITGLSIAPGSSILIRWADSDTPSSDDGLSVDDFTISAGLVPGVLTSGATNTGGGTGGGGTPTTGGPFTTPSFPTNRTPDSTYSYLFGNLHGHSTYSDGKASTLTPADDFNHARNTNGMDFLGISEHNHSTAGMHIANYKLGYAQAEAANGLPNKAGENFITLYGMEWGTISGGGHVVVYGFGDQLINWEENNYDILVAKSDYLNLFKTIHNQQDAFATLAHPNTSDYTGLTGGYQADADAAVVGVAVESGPSTSTTTDYTDFPASLAYINYYRSLLKQGYRVGANMDQDNHEMTFGDVNTNRTVAIASDRSRNSLIKAMLGMHFYASNDYNAKVSFTLNNYIMGSTLNEVTNLVGNVTHTDADGETLTSIQVYGGRVGGADATQIAVGGAGDLTFSTTQAPGETWYYYAVLTQADGNRIVTSPIWLTTADAGPLPVKLIDLTAALQGGKTLINWTTAEEINADHFEIERSTDGRSFLKIGSLPVRGSASGYAFTDNHPAFGTNYYRLRMVDKNGSFEYSKIVTVSNQQAATFTFAPNPASSVITIRSTRYTGAKVTVQIVDAAGNRVYNQQHSTGAPIQVNVSKLPEGMYVIRVNDEVSRLLINR
ncbi:MAG TPA: CehA/McbA family metallohydrolase [Flavisolibacter sp.]|nr:CehA/McbA family metallohydrolase [Flavisolibacter sp.]